jgi:hypothetical protein
VNDGFVGRNTLDKGVSRNAPKPIVLTVVGSVIDVNPLPENAVLPILVGELIRTLPVIVPPVNGKNGVAGKF